MSEEPRIVPDPSKARIEPEPAGVVAASNSTPSELKPASQLTPEEQMALFEKELKETDWGHQPC